MDNPILALIFPSLLLVPAMGALSAISGPGRLTGELRRKALHVSIAIVALTFPAILDSAWTVVAALGLVGAWMAAVRRQAVLGKYFGRVLNGVGRHSYGEFYYALAIAALLLVCDGMTAEYVIPLLVLGLADAAAAVFGRAWPVGRFRGALVGKTASGSAAFAVTAFVVSIAGIEVLTPHTGIAAVAGAALVAGTTTTLEAFSRAGLDNLTVPAGAWLILQALPSGV